MYKSDKRVVITLDAGGTNFVFGAIRANELICKTITLPSLSNNIDTCLSQLVKGFSSIIEILEDKPVAISFAFPGPADYSNGVIGGFLPNFPSFRSGIALGRFLELKFGIPVFINNDGDLFAYGEALAGELPKINKKLRQYGSTKQYKSLIGYTLGTGFGMGHVYDNVLHLGDNSCVETFCLSHPYNSNIIIEEGVSVRAIKRVYAELSGSKELLEPKDIFEIAEGLRYGNREAAITSFETMGSIAGNAIATAVTLLDGIVVIGGGLTAAKRYFMPSLLSEMRSSISTLSGETLNKVQMEIYDLDNANEFEEFANSGTRSVKVYGTENEYVEYNEKKKIGVAISTIGASQAVSLGAYNFALNRIDNLKNR